MDVKLDTRAACRLTTLDEAPEEIELSSERDAPRDGFEKTATTTSKAKPGINVLENLTETAAGFQLRYTLAKNDIKVTVSAEGVTFQVANYAPHKATPIELLSLGEIAQRSRIALGKGHADGAKLDKIIHLIGSDARSRFQSTTALPSRDATRSDFALSQVALTRPRNIDEAFDKLVATSTGKALVRRHTDNVMAWNMKWDLVTKAKKTFDFSYFSIERDAYGYAYLGALLEATLRGVQVRGITDWASNSGGHGFSMGGLGADYMQELAAHGADISFYNKPMNRLKQLVKDGVTFGVLASNHDKLAVADRGTNHAEGETGGRNVARAYHQDPRDNPKSWRDDSVQIRGKEVTNGLVEALERELAGPACTRVKPDRVNLKQRATELLYASQLMEAAMRSKPLSEAEKAAVRQDPAKQQILADQLVMEATERVHGLDVAATIKNKQLSRGESKRVQGLALELANDLELRGSRPKYDALDGYVSAEVKILDQVGAASAAPGDRFNELGPDLLQLISGAQKSIVIENPYVVMTEPMMAAFEEAAARGVKIDIVTNSPESTDSAATQAVFLNDWKHFLVRVPSARVFVALGERKFHSKAFVIDKKVSADTSYNADIFSGLVNGEVGAVSRSEAFAQDLIDAIQADLDDPSNKFREWSIQRDEHGTPIVDVNGELLSAFGPEHDVNEKLLKRYKTLQMIARAATRTELLSPLRHPSLK